MKREHRLWIKYLNQSEYMNKINIPQIFYLLGYSNLNILVEDEEKNNLIVRVDTSPVLKSTK